MPQLFPPTADAILKLGFCSAATLAAFSVLLLYNWNQPHYITEDQLAPQQPVPFSHLHHVDQLGIDCRYCHTSVEVAPNAGMPPTETCMTCHSQIWTNAPLLEPIRTSYKEDRPIEWTRVYNLPDFVNFDHSVHVSQGVACVECHGRIDQMPLTKLNQPLQMKWCLECHNDPYPNLRPAEQMFDFAQWESVSKESWFVPNETYHINVSQLDNCSVCHY